MIPQAWREAIDELARRKLRTGLTLLGLIFGVGAIVAMQAVGEGGRREAERLVQGLGLDNLIVQSVAQDEQALKEARKRSLGLSLADAQAARAVVPDADASAAEKQIKTWGVFSDAASGNASASGVTPAYFALSSLRAAQGRVLTAADEEGMAAVAVLGHQAAHDLFPHGDALGKPIKVDHVWLTVVGVLADRDLGGSQFEGVQLGLDANRVFLPLSTALARFRFEPLEPQIDRFILRLSGPQHMAADAKVLSALLDQRHAGVADYSLVVPQQLFVQHQKTQNIFRIVMAAIAFVSVLVGGIGIMNIMLANVLERRREIGLMRALGARRKDVIAQFMRESAVICIAGALLGLAFGVALALAIAGFAGWKVAWAPLPILLPAVVCAAIGLAFGIYPARQAAALDPIAALRTD